MSIGRKRKTIDSSQIECRMYFNSVATLDRFRAVDWARRSSSVINRRWVSCQWEPEDEPGGALEAVFQYTHICRNEGAYRGDSQKFFNSVLNAAGISQDEAGLLNVRQIHRIKCVEAVPERLHTPAVQATPPVRPKAPVEIYARASRLDDADLAERTVEDERRLNLLAFE